MLRICTFLLLLGWCLFGSVVAVAQSSVKANLVYYKGVSSLKEGKTGKAARLFKQVLKEHPKHGPASLALVKLHLSAGKHEKALQYMPQLLGAKGGSDLLQLERNYYHAYLNILKQQHSSAQTQLEQAITNSYNVDYPDFSVLARCYNALGYLNIVQNHAAKNEKGALMLHPEMLEKSRILFEESQRYNPQNQSALTNYVTINEALDKQPNFIDPYDLLEYHAREHLAIEEEVVREESAYETSTGKVYNDHLLPERTEVLLQRLNDYDELILMIDASGSMRVPIADSSAITRFDVMKNLAAYLLYETSMRVQMGAISVGGECGQSPVLRISTAANEREQLFESVSAIKVDGQTPVNDAIKIVPELFQRSTSEKAILLITDGMESCEPGATCKLAAWLGSQNITLHVLSFLNENLNPDEYASYTCMAATTGGSLHSVSESSGIQEQDYQFITEEMLLIPAVEANSNINIQLNIASKIIPKRQ